MEARTNDTRGSEEMLKGMELVREFEERLRELEATVSEDPDEKARVDAMRERVQGLYANLEAKKDSLVANREETGAQKEDAEDDANAETTAEERADPAAKVRLQKLAELEAKAAEAREDREVKTRELAALAREHAQAEASARKEREKRQAEIDELLRVERKAMMERCVLDCPGIVDTHLFLAPRCTVALRVSSSITRLPLFVWAF